MIIYAMSEYLRARDDGNELKRFAFRFNDGEKIEVAFADRSIMTKIKVPTKDLKTGINRLEFIDAPKSVLIRAVLRYHKSGADVEPLDQGLKLTRTIYEIDEHGKAGRTLKPGDKVARGHTWQVTFVSS